MSRVISTFGMPKVAQRHLIAEFAEELLNINNLPRHIFIEEAHEFIPQRVSGAIGKTFNAVSNLVVMGRNRGIGVTLINQRAATINKDVLTQLDTLLAFRNVAPQDRKALKEWVEYHAAEGDFDKFMQSLPALPTGEGWIWSPEFLGIFERIKIRQRETFHPDREKIGDKFTMPELDQVDIQTFIDRFSQKDKTPATKTETTKLPTDDGSKVLNHPLVIEMRNGYESRLMEKDMELRQRENVIDQIRRLVGGTAEGAAAVPVARGGNASMWMKSSGAAAPQAKILAFLSAKHGMKFTRSQICLAVGIATSGGNTTDAFSTLKRNNLIIEQGREIWINPDV